jgi:hypothetical protein
MAIVNTDGLDTKFYLVPTGTTLTTVTNIETAITTAEQIENIVTFGDFDFGTYAVNTLSVFGGDMVKSLGAKTIGNVATQVVFDAANETGQADIRLMHTDKSRRMLIVALDDKPAGSVTNPTYLLVEIAVPTLAMPITMDASITYNATLEFMQVPRIELAKITTP